MRARSDTLQYVPRYGQDSWIYGQSQRFVEPPGEASTKGVRRNVLRAPQSTDHQLLVHNEDLDNWIWCRTCSHIQPAAAPNDT